MYNRFYNTISQKPEAFRLLPLSDISSVEAPAIVGHVLVRGYTAAGVAVSGSYAYLADGSFGLQVANISNPVAPTIVGEEGTPGYARDVAISGSYAYVADDNGGLQVVDIHTPRAPLVVGSVDPGGSACDVAVSGGYAYVADDYQVRLLVIDVGVPTAITSKRT